MSTVKSAGIHCLECDCQRTYTGSTVVGDQRCDSCDHLLRRHQIDTQSTYADESGRLPDGFDLGAQFE